MLHKGQVEVIHGHIPHPDTLPQDLTEGKFLYSVRGIRHLFSMKAPAAPRQKDDSFLLGKALTHGIHGATAMTALTRFGKRLPAASK